MKRINLLPQHKQSDLYYEDLYRSVNTLVVLSVAILLLGVVAQVFVWIYLDRKEATVSAKVTAIQQQIDKSENAAVKQEIREVNTLMQDFDNLSRTTPQWAAVLKAFARLVPNGVKISSFDSDAKTGAIEISGYSPTRDLVIELYNNINGDKTNFKDINYPLENVSRPNDVQFNFKFFIQDGVLIPKQ